jgi:hypothetical protein
MVNETRIRSIVRQELERQAWLEEGKRFTRTMNWMFAVIVLEVLTVYALIIWRGV